MPKNDELERLQRELDEIDEWKRKKEIEDGIKEGVDEWKRSVFKWGVRICVPATGAILVTFYNLGVYVYRHWPAFSMAVDVWIKATAGGQ